MRADLLRHDRLPVRAPLLAPAADLAARDDRDRRPPPAAHRRRETAPAGPPDRRLPVRALPREGLPGPEDVLDRGARRGRADARRGWSPSRTAPAPRRSSSGWPTAAASASSPTTSAARSSRSWPSSRARSRSTRSRRSPAIPHGGTGDVKYHYGHRGVYETSEGEKISVRLYPNPSHLEFVDPVVTGGTRFLQSDFEGAELSHDPKRAVPVLLHGDAAFPAQGVVAETLNLQALKGYSTGGTIHLIQNNQVGFTTDPEDARSTPYAADMAKGFNVPIVHVNADDVEACSAAVRLAMAYRERWGRDIVIDVIGYRRFGHNETDEPAYTQPTMAAKIKAHPPVSEIYAEKLIERGGDLRRGGRRGLRAAPRGDVGGAEGPAREDGGGRVRGPDGDRRTSSTGELLDRTASPPVHTAVAAEKLRALNEALLKTPEGFNVHRKLRRPLVEADRGARAGRDRLRPGRGARLRLAADRGRPHPPHRPGHRARHLLPPPPRPPRREHRPRVHARCRTSRTPPPPSSSTTARSRRSPASASSTATRRRRPSALVLWEAQFGDFANAGQVIIDSFIVSGESKWGQTSRLTLLLPHGYEGSGPEHSSARIERFLALGAEGNIRIANPTTAAQYFHLLRRQALIRKPRPLIVFTPKGLLRLDRATASLEELTEGALPLHPRRPDRRRAAREGRAPGPLHRQGLLRHRRQRAPRRRPRTSRSPGSRCSTRSPRNS